MLKTRIAILASLEDQDVEGYKFYVNVLGNLGFKIRLFYEEAFALDYLLKPDSENEDNYKLFHF